MHRLLTLSDMLVIDSTLLDTFPLDARLDRALLVNHIKLECGNMQSTYTNTVIFRAKLDNWFRTHSYNIEKLVDTTLLDYNPIENYNRVEEGQRKVNRQENNSVVRNAQNTTTEDSNTTNSGSDTTKNVMEGTQANESNEVKTDDVKKSAFDSDGYSPYSLETVDSNTTGKNTSSGEEDSTVSYGHIVDGMRTVNGTGKEDETGESSGVDDETYQNTVKGNIGVTTSQQMIEQERRVALFNIYGWIVEELKDELFVGIYWDWN